MKFWVVKFWILVARLLGWTSQVILEVAHAFNRASIRAQVRAGFLLERAKKDWED